MKTHSVKLAVVILSLLFLNVGTFAQPNKSPYGENILNMGLKIFPESLQSNCPGIVESTIYNVVLLKDYFPNADYSRLLDKLNNLAQENVDPSIRYKAQLASFYLSFGNDIKIVRDNSSYEHDYIFKQIADQLSSKLLVSRQ